MIVRRLHEAPGGKRAEEAHKNTVWSRSKVFESPGGALCKFVTWGNYHQPICIHNQRAEKESPRLACNLKHSTCWLWLNQLEMRSQQNIHHFLLLA